MPHRPPDLQRPGIFKAVPSAMMFAADRGVNTARQFAGHSSSRAIIARRLAAIGKV